jgi:ADP-ribose pyrophosphatase YjhB (NUDIX family)
METTRHFVATTFVVHEGATLLHEHGRLGLWLPPGGHLERDELPHEAALREVQEETGLDVDLLRETPGEESELARPLPRPQQLLLEDINVADGKVGHQHMDFVYFAAAPQRDLDPASGEPGPEAWKWFTPEELETGPENLPEDVVSAARAAIDRIDHAASPGS